MVEKTHLEINYIDRHLLRTSPRYNNTYIYSALAAGRDYAGIVKDLKCLMRRERGHPEEVAFLKGTIKVAKTQMVLNRRERYAEKPPKNMFRNGASHA